MNLHASQKSNTFDSSVEATSMEVVSWGFRDNCHHISDFHKADVTVNLHYLQILTY